jgi:methylmalonyl-CoA mutase N-terminal domain/subunit
MEEMILKVMNEIDAYGGVEPAIEDGWMQLRLAERGLERKLDTDSGKNVIVGQNHFKKENEEIGVGDVFKLDPTVAKRALEKFQCTLDTRSQAAVDASLAKLEAAAAKDDENVMPYLVDCCHAYATVGEMVGALKKQWGEFKEPVNL